MEKKRNSVFYYIMLGILVLIIGVAIFGFFEHGTENFSVNTVNLDGKWQIEKLSGLTGANSYSTVIEPHNEEQFFAFYSNYSPIRVYYDGRLIYKVEDYDSFYGSVPSAGWHLTNLSENSESAKLVISGGVYGNPITKSYYGDARSFFIMVLKENWMGMMVCAVLVFCGITLLILHGAFHKALSRQHSLKYIGFFALFYGIAIFFDSGLISLLFPNAGLVDMLNQIFNMLCVVPMLLYVEDGMYEGFSRVLIRIVTGAYLACFIVVCILNFTQTVYFYEIVDAINIGKIVAYGFVMLAVGINSIKEGRNAKKNRIFLLGIMLLGSLRLADVLLCLSWINLFTSLGILFLTVVSMMLNMTEITEMLGVAMKAKLIGKLAYTDGLTGVGNTTAFREKLDSLELVKVNYDSIGIVQLDINNLKVVNDTLGHSTGDDLIKVGARVIKESFGTIGEVYRIGGDEFAVIVTCDHAPQRCDEAAAKFETILEEYNSNPKARFKLQIAYGIAFYKHDYSGSDLFLREIQKQADVLMYNNKREIKLREKRKSDLEEEMIKSGKKVDDDREVIVMD